LHSTAHHHHQEKTNTDYSYLGIIKRNFIYLDKDAFIMLYKSLVKSHLDYANSVWNPYRLWLIRTFITRCETTKNNAGPLMCFCDNFYDMWRWRQIWCDC